MSNWFKVDFTDKKIVLIDVDNLVPLVRDVIKETNQIIYNMKLRYSKVIAFQHPVSEQIYISSEMLKMGRQVY